MTSRSSSSATVSVVITSWMQREYLREAIESVLAQTHPPHEVVVADDASTDGSDETIREFARRDPRVVPILHARNVGMSLNRNGALERACGSHVCALDGDDRLAPRKLEAELEALRATPGAAIAYSNVARIDAAGSVVSLRAPVEARQPSGDIFCFVYGRAFGHEGTIRNELIERACLGRAGLYNPRFGYFDDWDLRIRLTHATRVAYNSDPLVEYRRHERSLSRRIRPHKQYLDLMAVIRANAGLLRERTAEEQAFVRRSLAPLVAAWAKGTARSALRARDHRAFARCLLEAIRPLP